MTTVGTLPHQTTPILANIERLQRFLDGFITFGGSLLQSPMLMLPWLRHLPPWRAAFQKGQEQMDEVGSMHSTIYSV
jgi:hypothetical protein